MASDRRRQKKLEKHKRKRKEASKRARARPTSAADATARELVRQGVKYPITSAWVSAGWQDLSTPNLVSLVVARERPDGSSIVGCALVDRTCLGAKNGWVPPPLARRELDDLVARLGERHGGVEGCDPLLAQSILFHAVDYARSLGFEPHPDAPLALFGPRPETLYATPWAKPTRPLYIQGPDDNAARIVARLAQVVGAGGYDLVARANAHQLGAAAPDEDDEYEADSDDDGDGGDDEPDDGLPPAP